MKKAMWLAPVLFSLSTGALAQTTNPYAGLWVGVVTVNKVSRSQYIVGNTPSPCPAPPAPCQADQATSLIPVPVGREATFRLILHIDENGTARLLKDVIQMWKNGVSGAPGHFVLVTDPGLIPNFTGAAVRDGDPVAKRVSAVAIDFPATSPNYALTMSGGITPPGTGTLSVTFTLPKDFPTNPFKHLYHPDHDNIGALGPVAESFDITRAIQLVFSSTDPAGTNPPDYGSAALAGAYQEQVAAGSLHKNPIASSGTFRLQRVSLTAKLNQ